MKKKRFDCYVGMILVLGIALFVTDAHGLTVFASVSENALKIVSENDTQAVTELLIVSDEDGNVLSVEESSKNIPVLGHRGCRLLVAQQQATYTDCTTFVIPESDTWGFEQTFARGELFDEFQKARMDPANWWYYTNNGASCIIQI